MGDSVSTPPPLSGATTPGYEIDYATSQSTASTSSSSGDAEPFLAPHERPGPIPFNGGYVQHKPRIFVTFYGSDWNKQPAVKERILNLFK